MIITGSPAGMTRDVFGISLRMSMQPMIMTGRILFRARTAAAVMMLMNRMKQLRAEPLMKEAAHMKAALQGVL